jgi:hypothetical protein
MTEDSSGRFSRRVPVKLELNMSGLLLSPDISFDIELPGADESVKRRLESILYVNQNNINQQELNQQVFGLLVLNRFMPPASGSVRNTADRGAPGVNNGYEFLSNQLSNWLSKVSSEVDIGVAYRPGDEVTEEEVDLSLTTEILNNRLVLDGNFGYISNNDIVEETESAGSFIGEFLLEYKLNRKGSVRVRGFNRSNTNSLLQINNPYTQGVGVFYREEFDEFKELWRKYFGRNEDESEAVAQ